MKRLARAVAATLALAAGVVVVGAGPASAGHDASPKSVPDSHGHYADCNVSIRTDSQTSTSAKLVTVTCAYGAAAGVKVDRLHVAFTQTGTGGGQTHDNDIATTPFTGSPWFVEENAAGRLRAYWKVCTFPTCSSSTWDESLNVSGLVVQISTTATSDLLATAEAQVVVGANAWPDYPAAYYVNGTPTNVLDAGYPSYACKRVARKEGDSWYLDVTIDQDQPLQHRTDEWDVYGGWAPPSATYVAVPSSGDGSERLTVPVGPYATGYGPPWQVTVLIKSTATAGHAFPADEDGQGGGAVTTIRSCIMEFDPIDPEKGATGHTTVPDYIEPDAPGQPGYVERFRECIAGAALLSTDGLVKVLGCVLRVGFEPSDDNAYSEFSSEASDSVAGRAVAAMGAVHGSWNRLEAAMDTTPNTCTGLTVTLPLGPSSTPFSPFQTCSEGVAEMASWSRLFALFGLYFMYAVAFARLIMSVLGYNFGMPGNSASSSDVTSSLGDGFGDRDYRNGFT
jgi:hypothetical protein